MSLPTSSSHNTQTSDILPFVSKTVGFSAGNETAPVRAAFLCSPCTGLRGWKKGREGKESSKTQSETTAWNSCIRKPHLVSLPHSEKPHSYYPKAVRAVQAPFPNTPCSFPVEWSTTHLKQHSCLLLALEEQLGSIPRKFKVDTSRCGAFSQVLCHEMLLCPHLRELGFLRKQKQKIKI